MSTDAKKVSAAKPMIGGAVHWAPAGTTLPTNATAKLDDAFVDMGYISEDGVTNNNERETEDIKAWGGDTVLSLQNGKTDTFGMTFIESLNIEVEGHLEPQYGALGNDWEDFEIRPGSNAIRAVWSPWVNPDYKPKIQILFNEVYLALLS